MSTVDLVLLGMVCEKPRSAYEIQKQIEYRNLSKWVRISSPSVYKKVIRLEQKAYLTSKVVREGKMPEKTIYAITPSGKEHFLTLMKEIASHSVSVLFDFNAVVANLNKVPKPLASDLIDDIRSGILESKKYMQKMLPQRQQVPLVGQTILSQQIMVLETLNSWIDKFESEFNSLES